MATSLSLEKKLARVRNEIGMKKTGYNSYGKYSYYEINQIYSEIKPLFAKHGIFTKPSMEFVEVANQLVVRTTLEVINTDNADDRFTLTMDSLLSNMKGASAPQNAGANNTYQLKYLYLDLLMLDDGLSDPDKVNTHDKETKQTRNEKQKPTEPEPQKKALSKKEAYQKHFTKEMQRAGIEAFELLEVAKQNFGKRVTELSITEMKELLEAYKNAGYMVEV